MIRAAHELRDRIRSQRILLCDSLGHANAHALSQASDNTQLSVPVNEVGYIRWSVLRPALELDHTEQR